MSSIKKTIKLKKVVRKVEKVEKVDVEEEVKDELKENTKCCNNCKKNVEISKYYKCKKNKDNICSKCIDCYKLVLKNKSLLKASNREKEQIIIGEIWKTIPTFQKYEASTLGRIRFIKFKTLLKPIINCNGYAATNLSNENNIKISIQFHRIIAITFLINIEKKLTINHKNKKKTDNRLENLEWATYKEQSIHKFTFQPKTNVPTSKSHNLENLENEIWKPIVGYERYQISNLGRIKYPTSKTKYLISFGCLSKKYGTISLTKDKISKHFFIHRLVASAFITNDNCKPYVNHIDSNTKNNNVNNLEWVTPSENTLHSYKNGLMKTKYKSIYQLDSQNKIIKEWNSITEASKMLNLKRYNIGHVLCGKSKTAGSFYWCYKSKYNPLIKNLKLINGIKIKQIDIKTNKIIKEWNSVTEAVNFIKIEKKCNISGICTCIKRTNNIAYGYKWEYAD